ncbi:cytochrome ubiquinol oxidase subunit I [Picrophilus oshimae DSM 9789]|uniref:Cytochrome ubiquinol oxidase subunit I n=2 Tax=Picrophilus oshimae TaxID=46632 RepID=Q6L0Q3_PICTO|nr:cytochrome ubiquinol oxidase subunit I [Picrophilus oshimae DSM 9789]
MVSYPVWDSAMFAYTISSHILLVTLTLGLALLITISEFIGIKYKNRYFLTLARKASTALVINFAVGTASGIFMAVELYLFWPEFMKVVGAVAMSAFYAEVFAFLLESITLMMYVYFWDNFKNRWNHWLTSIGVLVGTGGSAALITDVNAWMNTPEGSFNIPYYLKTGIITDVNPWKVFWEPSTFAEQFHMYAVEYFAGSMMLLGYFAYKYLRSSGADERLVYSAGLKILSVIAIIDIIIVGASGSNELDTLLVVEPLKYAALEQDMVPVTYGAPEHIFGIIINGHPAYYVNLPLAQSLLAYPFTFGHGYIPGLSSYPSSVWPPSFVHDTLDLMVGFGLLMGFFWLIVVIMYFMKKDPLNKRSVLKALMFFSGMAVYTMEDGWYTAEVGRVPGIILYDKPPYYVMTIGQAASTSPVVFPLGMAIIIFYIVLIPLTLYFMAKVLKVSNIEDDLRHADDDLSKVGKSTPAGMR